MKGLLIKDMCVFTRKMKAYFLLIFLFAVVPGGFLAGFAVMYTGMLPITAIAYDEQSKWDELAAMMPYSVFQLVFSKYVLGYIMTLIAAAICFVFQSIYAYLSTSTVGFPPELAVYVCIAFIITALDLPIILRFGTEKGRYIFLFITIGIAAYGVNHTQRLVSLFGTARVGSMNFLPVFLVVAFLANVVSVNLAMGSYKRRYRK